MSRALAFLMLAYLEMWEEALEGIRKHLITTTKHSGLKFVAELPQGIGGQLSPKMAHLACFLAGLSLSAPHGGILFLRHARGRAGMTGRKVKSRSRLT